MPSKSDEGPPIWSGRDSPPPRYDEERQGFFARSRPGRPTDGGSVLTIGTRSRLARGDREIYYRDLSLLLFRCIMMINRNFVAELNKIQREQDIENRTDRSGISVRFAASRYRGDDEYIRRSRQIFSPSQSRPLDLPLRRRVCY